MKRMMLCAAAANARVARKKLTCGGGLLIRISMAERCSLATSNLDGGANSPRCNVGHRVISKPAEICNSRLAPFGAKIRFPAHCFRFPQADISCPWRWLDPWKRGKLQRSLVEVASSLSIFPQSARRSNPALSQSTPVNIPAMMVLCCSPIDLCPCRKYYPRRLNLFCSWLRVSWHLKCCFLHATTLSLYYARSLLLTCAPRHFFSDLKPTFDRNRENVWQCICWLAGLMTCWHSRCYFCLKILSRGHSLVQPWT